MRWRRGMAPSVRSGAQKRDRSAPARAMPSLPVHDLDADFDRDDARRRVRIEAENERVAPGHRARLQDHIDKVAEGKAALPAQQALRPGDERAPAFAPGDNDALLHLGRGDEGACQRLSGRRRHGFVEAERRRKDQVQAGRAAAIRSAVGGAVGLSLQHEIVVVQDEGLAIAAAGQPVPAPRRRPGCAGPRHD